MVQRILGSVLPCVAVGIEVHQRHFPVGGEMRLQQGQAHEVVSTQSDHACALPDQPAGTRVRCGDHLGCGAGPEGHVARVDAGAAIEHAGRPGPERIAELPCERRLLTDRPRPESRARAVGGGEVERHAEDGEIRRASVRVAGQAGEARVAGPGHAERVCVLIAHGVFRCVRATVRPCVGGEG